MGASAPMHAVLVDADVHQVLGVFAEALPFALIVSLQVDVASCATLAEELFEVQLAGQLALAKVQAFNTVATLLRDGYFSRVSSASSGSGSLSNRSVLSSSCFRNWWTYSTLVREWNRFMRATQSFCMVRQMLKLGCIEYPV